MITVLALGVVVSCPYEFGSDMPSATFCVYRGVASGRGGEVCATDSVVIWSSVGSHSRVNAEREVYLGFVTDPGLVLRAVVDSRHPHRAEIVGYTSARNEIPQPLAGKTTLRTVTLGSSAAADTLSINVRESLQVHPGGCGLASYSGTFVGVIARPIETGTY